MNERNKTMLNNDIKLRLQEIEQKIERIERTHSARNDRFFNGVDLSYLDNIELDDTIDETPEEIDTSSRIGFKLA